MDEPPRWCRVLLQPWFPAKSCSTRNVYSLTNKSGSSQSTNRAHFLQSVTTESHQYFRNINWTNTHYSQRYKLAVLVCTKYFRLTYCAIILRHLNDSVASTGDALSTFQKLYWRYWTCIILGSFGVQNWRYNPYFQKAILEILETTQYFRGDLELILRTYSGTECCQYFPIIQFTYCTVPIFEIQLCDLP